MSWKKKLAAGTALIATATASIHIINKLVYFSATLDNLLKSPSGSYYEWKFGKIYYTVQGEGRPLLLIHDLSNYSCGYEWNKTVNELSKSHTVYCIDLLGCGRSDKPNITYTNYLYVQLVTDFIKNVIGKKTDVAATGESGAFVLAACRNDDAIINQIILVNPQNLNVLARIPTKRTKIVSLMLNLPVFGTFLYNIITSQRNIEDMFVTEYFYDSKNILNEDIRTYYESAHCSNSSKFLFSSIKGHYTTINLRHCLKDINNSIFIFVGKGNPLYKEHAGQYMEILPSIELAEIAESKYLPQLECPEAFIEQLNILLTCQE